MRGPVRLGELLQGEVEVLDQVTAACRPRARDRSGRLQHRVPQQGRWRVEHALQVESAVLAQARAQSSDVGRGLGVGQHPVGQGAEREHVAAAAVVTWTRQQLGGGVHLRGVIVGVLEQVVSVGRGGGGRGFGLAHGLPVLDPHLRTVGAGRDHHRRGVEPRCTTPWSWAYRTTSATSRTSPTWSSTSSWFRWSPSQLASETQLSSCG